MNLTLRNLYLSQPRYGRYLLAAKNDTGKAAKLYEANLNLAQAFHPILSQFEVIIRNSLNTSLTNYFNDPEWIINQKAGFMQHHSLRNSNYFLRSSVLKTELKLNRKMTTITSGKIISDQSFGFWLAFLLSHHYTLLKGQPIRIFKHKPTSENRASIFQKLDDIKSFRNRINHCEPICFIGGKIDNLFAHDIKLKIYDLLSWIDPQLIPFFKSIDNIKFNADNLMTI